MCLRVCALYSTVVQDAVAHVIQAGWVLSPLPVHFVKKSSDVNPW